MNSKTALRLSFIMMALLFANIEAAQAGLIQRVKVYIHHEFPGDGIYWLLGTATGFTFMLYVVFSPLTIGKERWNWLRWHRFMKRKPDFQRKRASIQRISEVLNKHETANAAHY